MSNQVIGRLVFRKNGNKEDGTPYQACIGFSEIFVETQKAIAAGDLFNIRDYGDGVLILEKVGTTALDCVGSSNPVLMKQKEIFMTQAEVDMVTALEAQQAR